jgi:subtilisin family serine protease
LSTGKGVTIALIDGGVQAGLPDLQGVVLPGANLENGDGDGRQDMDAFAQSPGHGTAMASLIAAQGRGTGLAGVAPDAKILPIVAQNQMNFAKAIRYAADHGAKVINVSAGARTSCPDDIQEAVAYALNKDAVIVAPAGDGGDSSNTAMTPASCKGVLSVGAVDPQFKPWEKTQRQPYVKVAAPGVGMRVVLKDGQLYEGRGTGDAAAVTSAAVAVIRAEHPTMGNRELVRQLVASALDIHEKGKDDRTGYGIIRPYRPLAGTAPKGTANPVFEEFDSWTKTHRPEGSKTTDSTKEDDGSPMVLLLVFGVLVAGTAVVCVLAFGLSRRNRPGPPPPMGQGNPPAPQWRTPPPGGPGGGVR